MSFINRIKNTSASLAARCSRYDRSGSGFSMLDDIQRHWIDAWAAPTTKAAR